MSAFVQAPFSLARRSANTRCKRTRARFTCKTESEQPAQIPIDDAAARNAAAEEMVRRDMELLKAKSGANASTTKKTKMESAKEIVTYLLLADVFLVVAMLAWLVIALVPHFTSQNDFLLDPWLKLWQPFTQPVLGALMAGTIVQGTISYITENEN